jgi:hypothetical protein
MAIVGRSVYIMCKSIRFRASHFRALWVERLWGVWLGALWSIIANFGTFRDEIWQPKNPGKYGFVEMIPHLSLAWWLVGLFAIISVWIFESSFRSAQKLREQIKSYERQDALEIVFDITNPAQRFWKRTQAKDKDGKFMPITLWEYRIGVKNITQKTVRNVRVSVETLGQIPVDPRDFGFQKDNKDCRDIAPGYTELVPILWVWPPQAGDAWGPTATALHGPLRVTARGDDVTFSQRLFDYHPGETPALVDVNTP